jgi:hypothetical protein
VFVFVFVGGSMSGRASSCATNLQFRMRKMFREAEYLEVWKEVM